MDRHILEEWKAQILAEVNGLEAQIAPLETELRARKLKLSAIEHLLELETHPLEAMAGPHNGTSADSVRPGRITDAAYLVLETSGSPMHYRDLCTAVVRNGVTIPGKDPATNLIARIGKDERFERVKRGTYALKEWRQKRKRG